MGFRERADGVVAGAGQQAMGQGRSLVVLAADDARHRGEVGEGKGAEDVSVVERREVTREAEGVG